MMAPGWIVAAVRDFGRAAGLGDLPLNERGVAAMRFENGVVLRFEYAEDELVVETTVPVPADASAMRRVLGCAHPDARFGVQVRAGYLARSGRAVFAVRLAAADVTQPVLNTAFGALWRAAAEIGGTA